ncbi:MAG TPA: hypothetical protein VM680_19730 [Verrucomicrobiae bacterium]|nr:hypothetical protein [Verrucomicrobiae bacterium]
MTTEIRWYAKATAVLLLICLVLFFAPLLIGVWLPDVASAPRNVLAEERAGNGEVVRVIQYWNRVDFYSTELHYAGTNGAATVCTLDADDSKHWSVPLEVDWEKKKAKVMLGAGHLRIVDLVSGEWEQ